MAQKITGYIKLQIPAGKATPAPPVGPALGQHGVNIMDFTKQFNEKTQKDAGLVIPVVITEIQMDKKKIRAKVSMFGRETDVELEFNQIEALV